MFNRFGLVRRLRVVAAVGFVLGISPAYAAGTGDGVVLPSPYQDVSGTERSFGRGVALPQILSAEDTELYRRIFEVQERGQWQEADRLIGKLSDPILLGHVMAQRYLHPTKYRSKYRELKEWLTRYSDLPQAPRLYALAMRRKPGNWKNPPSPDRVAVRDRGTVQASPPATTLQIHGRNLSRSDRSKVRNFKRHIRAALRRGQTLVAKRTLRSKEVQKLFSTVEYDQARARLGQAYFSAGRDKWALEWAGAAAQRSGKYLPQAHWTAGMANWRLGNREAAAREFALAAERSQEDDWFHAGASFWAARAYLVTRQPEKVNAYLEMAAVHQRTFYGLLAARVLGKKDPFSWDIPASGKDALDRLARMPVGERSFALLQVGRVRLAESELRRLALGADTNMANAILALAAQANMASLAVRLGSQLYPDGGGFDGAAYPVPTWTPPEGFRVDRALIYALIHQESKFNPKAKSWAGARGLMQLMPGTASFVAGDRAYRRGKRAQLFKPEHNLELGQRYLEILLNDKNINGDLFLLAAAWNGGPGNLNKWRRQNSYQDDPLFFIESIPARETRNFIERVLANLWIYRDRLQQPAPSLDAIAAGDWPVYMALGQDSEEVAQVDGSRR